MTHSRRTLEGRGPWKKRTTGRFPILMAFRPGQAPRAATALSENLQPHQLEEPEARVWDQQPLESEMENSRKESPKLCV